MDINNHNIQRMEKPHQPFLIAEIGVNYYDIAIKLNISLIEAAKLMIKEAFDAGVDAVKFQSYKANTLASKNAVAYWDTTKEPTKNQFELFSKFDKLAYEDYLELISYTQSLNGIFLTTCFDFESIELFGQHLPAFKIASADITNIPLIEKHLSYNKPMLFSTGASKMSEVMQIYSKLKEHDFKDENIAFLHCVLEYPTTPLNANLNKIQRLKTIFPSEVLIGYSDHVPVHNEMLTSITASLLGARIIEKHFTLDKNLIGNDHYHAMDPDDIRIFRKKMDYVCELTKSNAFDFVTIEEKARKHARRSLIAKKALTKGDLLDSSNVTFKRPGLGISPSFWEEIINKKAKINKNLEEDAIIYWKDLIFD